jgi:hypothetical protein
MNQIKVWQLTTVAVICALLAGLAVAFYFKHEQAVQAEALPNAARIQRVDGEVAFSDALNPSLQASDATAATHEVSSQNTEVSSQNAVEGNAVERNAVDGNAVEENEQRSQEWIRATPNQPFSVGDRIYTREDSHASLAFTGRNFARLDPNTGLDVLELSDDRTQLALRDGSAIFDVGYLAPGQLFEVGTPYGAVDFQEPGLYNVGFDDNGSVLVSVLSGVAQVVGLEGSGRISKGEILTLVGQTAAQVALSRLNGNDAGYLVDDYYRYQYGDAYDGRYNNYDAYLSDPFYYDPYRHNVSYQYAPAFIPGLNDLDNYGDWQNVNGYGNAWRPRVAADWAPYQEGYWVNDYPYGPTWVSSEAWGYAPYHYGRWANVDNQWFWIPDGVKATPRYAPALVAFVPFTQANEIGWVPLAPGDPYVPRYYDQNWRPYYLTRGDIQPPRVVNLEIPGAVTVIPLDQFGRVNDRHSIRRVDPRMFAGVRPVLDPLTLAPLRNAAVHSAWGRGKIDLPPGIAKKLRDTPVFVVADPRDARFRKDLATALHVERVPEKFRKQELKFERKNDDGRAPVQAARAAEFARRQQIDQLAAEARRGNAQAKQQVRELEREQRKQAVEQQQAARKMERQQQQANQQASQQARGERVGRRAQEQPRAERPQMQRAEPQIQRAQPQMQRVQPKAERKQERQAQPQPRFQQRPERVVPQPSKHDVKQQPPQATPRIRPSSPATQKHDSNKQAQPAQPQGQGGGKGKGKKQ